MFDSFKKSANRQVSSQIVVLILGLVLASALGMIWLDFNEALPSIPDLLSRFTKPVPPVSADVKKFVSEQDFKDYLEKSAGFDMNGFGGDIMTLEQGAASDAFLAKGAGEAERVSGTNVQVAGIDEPDIVKTDGKEIYFSKEFYGWWGRPIPAISIEESREGISFDMMPEYQAKTALIKAFPPADLKVDSEIDKSGNLLLNNKMLLVFSNREIFGFDVANPVSPTQKWNLKLDDNAWLITSRLKDNKVYLIVQTNINQISPCPIRIMEGTTISCQDIYHPVVPTAVDSTFTIMVLNPGSGQVENTVSFVGSSSNSVVYMSNQAVYLTYAYQADMVNFMLGFIKEKARDLYPSSVIAKLEKLAGYDISYQAKIMEMEVIVSNYQNSLDDDDRLKLENELENRLGSYMVDHLREIDRTGLVKIGLNDFRVLASGVIPGHPLNQFSLDEYDNHLRIAMTVGQRWWGWGFGGSSDSTVNDVYVLDANLKQVGSIQGLGLSERIYAARFVGSRGYLVTFRETDPFYVLDLSKPSKPLMAGELKIPGYSSYLEPIKDNLVLGIGKEDSQVKISLFDVSLASNPKEIAKYTLKEGWSEVLSNHHAFLLDPKHEIFFLPGGEGGYVFSYKNNGLEMKKAISETGVKRAIYLNDYLYIIGQDKIVVLNELDWTRVAELNL
ncbi:beta-propeller domain-containing protein [Candidatus Parcubacteria bacterium]|nr:beta-propeller domain-containing protein [Candidatus Parcubacteria bacterium]